MDRGKATLRRRGAHAVRCGRCQQCANYLQTFAERGANVQRCWLLGSRRQRDFKLLEYFTSVFVAASLHRCGPSPCDAPRRPVHEPADPPGALDGQGRRPAAAAHRAGARGDVFADGVGGAQRKPRPPRGREPLQGHRRQRPVRGRQAAHQAPSHGHRGHHQGHGRSPAASAAEIARPRPRVPPFPDRFLPQARSTSTRSPSAPRRRPRSGPRPTASPRRPSAPAATACRSGGDRSLFIKHRLWTAS